MKLRVVKEAIVAPNIKSFELSAVEGTLPGFTPGAHIKVSIPDGGEREYSLINLAASSKNTNSPETYKLGVLLESDSKGGSSHMHSLSEGDVVECTEPKNDFPLGEDANPLLIAGGIGITPITAMISSLVEQNKPFEFHYAGRTEQSLAFVPELSGLAGDHLQLHYDDQDNALDLAGLMAGIDPSRHVYVCGPKGMIEAVKELAEKAGIASEQVHFELFSSAAAEEGDESFEVELSSTGDVYTVPAGRTIIEVLEEAGHDIMYDCQRGDCGICQTDVLEGVPDHRDVVLSEDERQSGTIMQICVSRAKSKRLKLEL